MNGKHVKLDTLVDYHLRAYAGNGLRKLRLRTVLNMLGPLDGQLCLELVGDEALSYNLREAGSLLGCRWCSMVASKARAAMLTEMVGDHVYVGDNTKLPFADGQFDAVVVADCFQYLESDDAFVAECHRVLKSSGRLIVMVPRKKSWSLIRSLKRWTGLSDDKAHLYHKTYTEAQLFDVLKDGFDVQEVRTISGFFTELTDIFLQLMSGSSYTDEELVYPESREKMQKIARIYAWLFPLYMVSSVVDRLLFFLHGYDFVVRAKRRMWVPRRTPHLRDGRSIAEAALQSKIGTATD